MSIRNFSKDTLDTLDYTMAFGPTPVGAVPSDPGWLVAGDLITGSPAPTITITGSDNALTCSTGPSVINSGLAVLFWLTGGTSGVTYTVSCFVTTVAGRTLNKSITIDIRPG